MSFLGIPLGAQLAPEVTGMTPAAAPQPFLWGAGGAKLTPGQLLAQQQQAAQLSRPDYSPVSSIWQGLGRVVDNVHGALETRSNKKEALAQQAQHYSVAQALLSGDKGAIGAGYAAGGDLADLAGKVYDTNNPKPKAPNEFQQRLIDGGILPGTPQWTQMNLGAAQNISDPTVTVPLPGGQTYVGPRSGMQAALGGGGPVSSPSGGGMQPPATLPPDFDFGGPTQPASGGFR